MLHPSMNPDVLDICGILPVRSRIRRSLLHELTGLTYKEMPKRIHRSVLGGEDGEESSSITHPSSRSSNQSQDEPQSTTTHRRMPSNPIRFLRTLSHRNQLKKETRPPAGLTLLTEIRLRVTDTVSEEIEEMAAVDEAPPAPSPPSPPKEPKSKEAFDHA